MNLGAWIWLGFDKNHIFQFFSIFVQVAKLSDGFICLCLKIDSFWSFQWEVVNSIEAIFSENNAKMFKNHYLATPLYGLGFIDKF